MAEAAAIHFRSVANQIRFLLARRGFEALKDSRNKEPQLALLRKLLADETRLARRLHELQCRDSRLGFEASNHYFYVSVDLAEKVLNCRHLLSSMAQD